MWSALHTQIGKLSGTRRFATGWLALYIVGWLAERALTLFWEKLLEKQAPAALHQVTGVLSTDLATGMALMALLVLCVPPLAQWLFEASAGLTRFMELRSKRLSRRDYLASIADEAIHIAREARAIAMQDRWNYSDPAFATLKGGDRWDAEQRWRAEQQQKQGQDLEKFVAEKLGRAKFVMQEFVDFGFGNEVSRLFDSITNYHCLSQMSGELEVSAHKVRASLMRDGYPVSEYRDDGHQFPPSTELKTPP